MSESAIGMFDSGIGGLTVMREVMRALPNEKIIYFGDTARLPYGNKSADTIMRYSAEIASFLMTHNVKMLVIACNTASSYALKGLEQQFQIPIIGVIEAGAFKASVTTRNQRIGVLGTKATIQSGAYQESIQKLLPHSKVISIPCPLFVPLVEEDFTEHPSTKLIVEEYLKELHHEQIDTLLLGCTHYPFLIHLIQQYMGPAVAVVDSAQSCAEQIKLVLDRHQLHAPLKQKGSYRYYVTDEPAKFCELGIKLFGSQSFDIQKVSFF
jgi:glutamate racemase